MILKPGPRAGVVSSTGQHEPVSLVSRQTVMDRGDVRSTDIKIERWQSEQGSAVIRLPEGKRGQTFLKLGGDICWKNFDLGPTISFWSGGFIGIEIVDNTGVAVGCVQSERPVDLCLTVRQRSRTRNGPSKLPYSSINSGGRGGGLLQKFFRPGNSSIVFVCGGSGYVEV